MPNNNSFDPSDPTLPANLPPELKRIDSHLKDDGRYWQAHLPSEERLHQMARMMAPHAAGNTPAHHRGFPFRTFAAISSTAVVVGLLAALFVVLAYNRGNQTHPITKATAIPTSIPTPPAPLSAYFFTFIPNSSDPHPNCCNVMHALNASNGQQRWQRQLDTPSIPGAPSSFKPELPHVFAPTIVSDGKLFIFTGSGSLNIGSTSISDTTLYALRTSDGKLLWQKSLLHDVI